jgi:hypothetical protein
MALVSVAPGTSIVVNVNAKAPDGMTATAGKTRMESVVISKSEPRVTCFIADLLTCAQ